MAVGLDAPTRAHAHGLSGSRVGRADNQQRRLAAMAHVLDRAAEEDVANEAMTVGGHRNEIALLLIGQPQDLARRVSHRQPRGHRQSRLGAERGGGVLQIRAVLAYLLRFRQVQAIEIARGPAIGDVHEQHFGAGQAREVADMRQQHRVGIGVIERGQDSSIHAGLGRDHRWPRAYSASRPYTACCTAAGANMSNSSFRFSVMMTSVTVHPSSRIAGPLTNVPIFARSLVKRISGHTAKPSCSDRITWLATISSVVRPSPNSPMMVTAGMIAIRRVTSRRSHGRIRKLRKPSITI